MDQWSEATPAGSNVWVIAREMYQSCCLCVSNRSDAHRRVTVDCRGSQNVTTLASIDDRRDTGHIVRDVASGATVVVCVLSPTDEAHAMDVEFTVVAEPLELALRRAAGVAASGERDEAGEEVEFDPDGRALFNAELQSAAVEGWLQRRAVLRQ